MIRILAIVCGVLVIALGIGGWLLKESYEENGKLKLSVDALTKANEAKSNATKSRSRTEVEVRQMAPADKRGWLLGKPPDPKR